MKKIVALVICVLMVVAIFAACSAESTEEQAEETAQDVVETAEEVEATEDASKTEEGEQAESVDPSDVKIGGIVHVENQWGSMLLAGMQAACDEYGVEFVSGNYNGDNAKENEILNTYASTGVDGICASVLEGSVQAYKEFADDGIPIGIVNLDMETDYAVTTCTYNNYDLGAAMVPYATEFIKENLDSKPVYHTIRVIEGTIYDQRGDSFADGMAEAFGEEYGAPVSVSCTLDAQEAIQQASDALTANPDINIIFCECESSAIGAMAAIENAGLVGKVFVFAVDCSEQMCEFLMDDNNPTLQACSAQNSYEMGYKGCKDVIETVLGKRTDYTVGEVTYLPPQAMTKDNLDDVKAYYDMLKSYSS